MRTALIPASKVVKVAKKLGITETALEGMKTAFKRGETNYSFLGEGWTFYNLEKDETGKNYRLTSLVQEDVNSLQRITRVAVKVQKKQNTV